ncbi:MAG: hypothetical protein KDA91_15070 [Planctomycetaceae bacterium]|nr:hypothetical protein [Planctomycetaceae bacterium]
MMTKSSLRAILTLALCLTASQVLADEKASNEKPATQAAAFGKLTLNLPSTWKDAEVVSRMRLGKTYHTPVAEGDKDPGELTVFSFPGGGGGVAANIQRWIGQFQSAGRKSSIKTGKAGESTYYLAEISGTYKKSIGPPIQQRTEDMEGYRMIGVILEADGEVYYLKLTGPDATIRAQAHAFRTSFGGHAAHESDYAL